MHCHLFYTNNDVYPTHKLTIAMDFITQRAMATTSVIFDIVSVLKLRNIDEIELNLILKQCFTKLFFSKLYGHR